MTIIDAKRSVTAGIAVFIILLVCGWAYLARPHPRQTVPSLTRTASADRAGILDSYGKLPLRFESNVGQIRTGSNGPGSNEEVKFLAHGQGYTLLLTDADAVLKLRASAAAGHESQAHETNAGSLQMKLTGASPRATVQGADELPGRSNYFVGSDPGQWHTDVPNYASVRYRDVYPGIDLVYYGNQGQLEYDFIVAPGADPGAIHLDIGAQLESGAQPDTGSRRKASLHIDESGDLVIQANGGEVRFRKPVVYQPDTAELLSQATATDRAIAAGRATTEWRSREPDARPSTRVDSRYKLEGSHRVSFEIGEYDRSRPLVIDPTLSYSSYLGGSSQDQGFGIAVDAAGNSYVTGCTASPDFSVNTGAAQTNFGGGGDCGSVDGPGDAFVAKVNTTGTALVYATFLGGSGGDQGWAIAADASGNAYVVGKTTSQNFPFTPGAFRTTPGGKHDLFVTKLNPAGSALVYSTYLGGSDDDGFNGAAIAVDAAGNVYVTGDTDSADFPHSAGAYQTTCTACDPQNFRYSSFVTKLNPTGSALVYSTFLGGSHTYGGSQGDMGKGIAVDAAGDAYLTGVASTSDFPFTPGAFQTACAQNAPSWGYITKLDPTGSQLLYSTYVCGGAGVSPSAIAIDGSGSAYVTGLSDSGDLSTTPGAYQIACPSATSVIPCDSPFVIKLKPDGSAPAYLTYLGGTTHDDGNGIAVDSAGNAYVVGTSYSTNFPTTTGSFQPRCSGGCLYGDAFMAELNPSGSALVYSTLYGGAGIENGNGIALDASGNVYIAGITNSTKLPVTPGVFQPQCGGGCGDNNYSYTDAFVAKFGVGSGPSPVATTTTLAASPTSAAAGASVTLTATVVPASGTTAPAGTVTFAEGTTTLGTGTLSGAGVATYSTSSLSVGTHSITASYGGDSGDSASTSTAASVTITAAAAPAAPTGVTAIAGNAQVTLSWTASSGAATYNIFQGTSAGGESTTAVQTGITGTSAVIAALTNGSVYYFTVKAVDGNGTSAASSEVSARPNAPSTTTGGHHGGGALGGNALLALVILAALRVWRNHRLGLGGGAVSYERTSMTRPTATSSMSGR